jgi:MFS family permease
MTLTQQFSPDLKIILLLSSAIFVSTLGLGLIGPLMPLYADSLGASGFLIGFMFSGFSIARLISMPVFGRISDRWKKKPLLLIGLFSYTVLSFGYIGVENGFQLFLVRFFHGMAGSLVIPIAMSIVGELSPREKEGRTMRMFSISIFISFGIGPLIGGSLVDRFGMETPFRVMGLLSTAAFLFLWIVLPSSYGDIKRKKRETSSYRNILRSRRVHALMVFRIVIAFSRGVIIPFVPLLARTYGAPISTIGILLTSSFLITALLQYFTGVMADRYSRMKLIVLGMCGNCVAFLFVPWTSDMSGLWMLQILGGISAGISLPAGLALAVRYGKDFNAMGSMMGLFNMGMSVGVALGALSGGILEDIIGLRSLFLVSSIITFLGMILFYSISLYAEDGLKVREEGKLIEE